MPQCRCCSCSSAHTSLAMQMTVIEAYGFARSCCQVVYDTADTVRSHVVFEVHDLMIALGRKLAVEHGWLLPAASDVLRCDMSNAVATTDCLQLLGAGDDQSAVWSLCLASGQTGSTWAAFRCSSPFATHGCKLHGLHCICLPSE